MALIVPDFNIHTIIEQNEFHFDHSRQIVHKSKWSNFVGILEPPTFPQWTGTFRTIEVAKWDQRLPGVRAWLSALNGQANIFDLPIHETTIDESVRVIRNGERVDGIIVHDLEAPIGGAVPGVHLQANGKLYIIRKITPTQVILDPQRRLPDGTRLQPTDVIRVRSLSSVHPAMPRTRDTYGPYSLDWIEA